MVDWGRGIESGGRVWVFRGVALRGGRFGGMSCLWEAPEGSQHMRS